MSYVATVSDDAVTHEIIHDYDSEAIAGLIAMTGAEGAAATIGNQALCYPGDADGGSDFSPVPRAGGDIVVSIYSFLDDQDLDDLTLPGCMLATRGLTEIARVELGEPEPDDNDGDQEDENDGDEYPNEPSQYDAPGDRARPLRFLGHTHVWSSPHGLVGGNQTNPGVWGGSGDSLTLITVCACGAERREYESRQNDDYSTRYTYPRGTFPWGTNATEPGDEWPRVGDVREHAARGEQDEAI